MREKCSLTIRSWVMLCILCRGPARSYGNAPFQPGGETHDSRHEHRAGLVPGNADPRQCEGVAVGWSEVVLHRHRTEHPCGHDPITNPIVEVTVRVAEKQGLDRNVQSIRDQLGWRIDFEVEVLRRHLRQMGM